MKRTTYPKEDDKSEAIQKLKGMVRNLQKENNRLKSELRTMESAFVKTQGFLRKQMWDFSVEEVVDAVKKERRLKATEAAEVLCEKCGSPMDSTSIPNVGIAWACRKCSHRYVIKRVV